MGGRKLRKASRFKRRYLFEQTRQTKLHSTILPAECLLPQVVNYVSHYASRMLPQVVNYVSHYTSRMLTSTGSKLCFTLRQQNLSKPTMFVRKSPLVKPFVRVTDFCPVNEWKSCANVLRDLLWNLFFLKKRA